MSKEIIVVGSLNLDLVTRVTRLPQPGETLPGLSFERHTGGKGANQAVAASLAGASVRMIARHGSDGLEQHLLATLTDAGVDITSVLPVAGPSGVAVIFVDAEGQNSIVVVPGSNGQLLSENIRAQRDQIEAAGIVLTQLETPSETLEETLAIASAANVPVMLDPAPMSPLSPAAMQRLAWLTPNETEAEALLGSSVSGSSSLKDFAERLLALGVQNVLLKLGAKGAFLATREGLREMVPGHVVTAVDSTAAGDALNGAMAAALVEGADPVEAVRFGVAAAAISVTRHGAIPSLARRAEIDRFRAGR